MISVLILTKNESQDLPECLASVSWSDDVHVFDSFSDDNTVAVGESLGAIVTQRAFDGYATQRNTALHTLPFRHPWVLLLDADERVSPALVEEMKLFVLNPEDDVVAARIRRRDFFMGVHLAHAQISPYYIRLVQPREVCYTREVNEVLTVNGRTRDLTETFDHYPFSKGIRHWIDKHNIYSTMEAQHIVRSRGQGSDASILRIIRTSDFNDRRSLQKELFYRLPCRPLIKWLYMVVVRRAFLDGAPGMNYAFLQAIYEYMIIIKTKELQGGCPAQSADSPGS